jgi:FtsP/CotA-like multicopper oxidase with cupredoxin domain
MLIWMPLAAISLLLPAGAYAQSPANETCSRPAVGSVVSEPKDLRSQNGVLKVALTFREFRDAKGNARYCYVLGDGNQSPNLRLKAGDLLILTLKNGLDSPSPKTSQGGQGKPTRNPCTGAVMSAESTNLHFHGLTVPPVCHQDDVLKTSVLPSDPPFEYRVRIPADQPSGLYWYHPHLHGFTKAQVLGGASGALIIEGIEDTNRQLAGLPERVLIIRDQDLLNPNAAPANSELTKVPPAILDRDGDARNSGTGSGKPAKDLSLNFVPVPYPDYSPAIIRIKPAERQIWRVLNASSITYLNLQLLFRGAAQNLGIVAVDGVPLNQNGLGGGDVVWMNHLGVAPGGRVEFIVAGPPSGTEARLVTRGVNTGPGGENDPVRPIARIVSSDDAPEPQSALAASHRPVASRSLPWLGTIAPVHTRKLYFSEKLEDPKDPNSPTTFYLTVDGETPVPFDPNSSVPNIVVHQGDVEDWIIENRSQELHDFHIHQVHFLMLEWFGVPINEPFLRDTINVPFWDGVTVKYPSVKLRMDFRDPNAIGVFPYHCHLLEHEDAGMMGLIRVEPAEKPKGKQ